MARCFQITHRARNMDYSRLDGLPEEAVALRKSMKSYTHVYPNLRTIPMRLPDAFFIRLS
jgi:hypothetical protein